MEPTLNQTQPIWPKAGEPTRNGILETMQSCISAATMLRLAGALTVIAAMSSFLLQDWSAGSDAQRYYMLLAQTLLLAGGGFGLSFLLKENKGARVFFGLGLLSITANMATLGALIFSVTQWSGGLASYPGFATWQADPASLGMAIAAGAIVSLPVAWFGYMVLARRSAALLSGLFLFGNLLLLLPVRESLPVGIIAAIGVALPLWLLHKRVDSDVSLRTPEGYFALATLFVPVGLVVVRSLWLYQADALLQATLAAIAYAVLRVATPLADPAGKTRGALETAAVVAALAVAYPLAMLVSPTQGQMFYTLCGGISAALILDIALRSPQQKDALGFVAASLLALLHLKALVVLGGVIAAPLCIVAGAAVCIIGKVLQQRLLLVLGAATALAGLVQQAYNIVTLVDFSGWAVLAVLGASTIIAASVIERYGAVIKLKWSQMAAPKPADDA